MERCTRDATWQQAKLCQACECLFWDRSLRPERRSPYLAALVASADAGSNHVHATELEVAPLGHTGFDHESATTSTPVGCLARGYTVRLPLQPVSLAKRWDQTPLQIVARIFWRTRLDRPSLFSYALFLRIGVTTNRSASTLGLACPIALNCSELVNITEQPLDRQRHTRMSFPPVLLGIVSTPDQ